MPCIWAAAVVAYDLPLQPPTMPMLELLLLLSSLCLDVCISTTKIIDWCHHILNYSNIILFIHIASELLGGAAFVIHGMNQGLYCCIFQLVLQDDCWIGAASPESNLSLIRLCKLVKFSIENSIMCIIHCLCRRHDHDIDGSLASTLDKEGKAVWYHDVVSSLL